MPGQIITLTLDRSWRFSNAWTDDLGRRIAEVQNGAGDKIIFEIVDSSAADEFMRVARALQ